MFHVKHGQTGQSPPRWGWLLQIGNAPDADSVRICRHLPVFRLDVSRETPHMGTGIVLHGMLGGRSQGNVQYRSPFRPRHLAADPEVHPWSKVAHVSMRWRCFTWNIAHWTPDAYPQRAASGDPFLRKPSMPPSLTFMFHVEHLVPQFEDDDEGKLSIFFASSLLHQNSDMDVPRTSSGIRPLLPVAHPLEKASVLRFRMFHVKHRKPLAYSLQEHEIVCPSNGTSKFRSP